MTRLPSDEGKSKSGAIEPCEAFDAACGDDLLSLLAMNTNKPMTARAIPSVAPSNANEYLKKLECFCFEEQFLNPGEEALLPVRFIFDSDIPDSINNVALSYTIFDITNYDEVEIAHHDMR